MTRLPEKEIDHFNVGKFRPHTVRNNEDMNAAQNFKRTSVYDNLEEVANSRKKLNFDRANFEQEKSSEFLKLDVHTNPMHQFCQRLAERKMKIQYKSEINQDGEDIVEIDGVEKPLVRTLLGQPDTLE